MSKRARQRLASLIRRSPPVELRYPCRVLPRHERTTTTASYYRFRDDDYADVQVPDSHSWGGVLHANVPRGEREVLWMRIIEGHRDKGFAGLQDLEVAQPIADQIGRDVGRTFPGYPLFAKESGRLALARVLSAYALLDPDLGYCQGLNFVVGMLLERSFIPAEVPRPQ